MYDLYPDEWRGVEPDVEYPQPPDHTEAEERARLARRRDELDYGEPDFYCGICGSTTHDALGHGDTNEVRTEDLRGL